MALHVPHFGGGVALSGSPDTRAVTEVEQADSVELTDRGSITQASDCSDYLQLIDLQGTPDTWAEVLNIHPWSWVDNEQLVAFGVGDNSGGNLRYLVARFAPVGETTPIAAAKVYTDSSGNAADRPYGVATFAPFPYVDVNGDQLRPLFINIGPRYDRDVGGGGPPGLYVLYVDGSAVTQFKPISEFDFLGTGNTVTSSSSSAGGTSSEQAQFRGIASYNAHLFGWGVDGPNRLMFSNPGNPFMWGNDNQAASGDRSFTDSDAIIVGGSGERIMGALAWNDRLWLGTNRELHFVAGYGRDSFLKNGSAAIKRSQNVLGPHAMCEGPDGLLYGVGTEGLWVFDGAGQPDPVGRKLIQFGGRSPGFWDLLWSSTGIPSNHPDHRNTDLVWTMSVPEKRQVWVVIPYCDATDGHGSGSDTVIVKYHVDTGGFTRQVLASRAAEHGCYVPPGRHLVSQIFMVGSELADAGSLGTTTNVERYAFRSTNVSSPRLPFAAPAIQTVEYAPFGPEGVGVLRKVYVTLAWESGISGNFATTATVFVDGQSVGTVALTVGPSAPPVPSDGDVWVNTAGTDTDLGNATAGALVPAAADYLVNRYVGSRSAWVRLPVGGQKNRRATVPVAFTPTRGARLQVSLSLPGSSFPSADLGGRVHLESIGLEPPAIRSAV